VRFELRKQRFAVYFTRSWANTQPIIISILEVLSNRLASLAEPHEPVTHTGCHLRKSPGSCSGRRAV